MSDANREHGPKNDETPQPPTNEQLMVEIAELREDLEVLVSRFAAFEAHTRPRR